VQLLGCTTRALPVDGFRKLVLSNLSSRGRRSLLTCCRIPTDRKYDDHRLQLVCLLCMCLSVCLSGWLAQSFLSVLHISVWRAVVCICVPEQLNRSLSAVTHYCCRCSVCTDLVRVFNFLMRAGLSKKREGS